MRGEIFEKFKEIEKEAKKEEIFGLGKKVVVKRSSKELESGWTIVEKNKDRVRVEKKEKDKILEKWVTKENLIDWKIESLKQQKEQIIAFRDITPEDRRLIEKIEKEINELEELKK